MAEKKSKLAEIKTKENTASVEDFINSVDNEQKRNDSFVILEMMKKGNEGRAEDVGQFNYWLYQ
jgi:hypothetical protein